jgi:hypothetical protein
MPAVRRPDDDEDLGELPPMDGAVDEGEVPAPEEEEELAELPADEGEDPFDDTTAEKPADLEDVPEIDASDPTGLLEDAADAEDLDVGAHELDDDERAGLLDDADEPGVGDEDFGLDQAAEALVMDAGEEGFDADDDELREEDLPRLDADEDGELDDDALTDEWPAAQDEERPPWDDRAWERALDVPRTGLARSVVPLGPEEGALVAGAALVVLSGRGATPVEMKGIHGGAIVGVARFGADFVVATERGGVFVGRSGDFREVGRVEGTPADVVCDGTRLWLRTRAGALLSAPKTGPWEKHFGTGVEALTVSGGAPLAVAGGRVVRGLERAPWGPPLPALPPGATPLLRARGEIVLAGAFGAGAFRSIRGGAWERIDATTNVTALALIDDQGSAVLALHSAAEDRAWIARAGASDGARIVAEIGGEADQEDDPRVLDLAWDDATRILWAVGPFGVAVLRPR